MPSALCLSSFQTCWVSMLGVYRTFFSSNSHYLALPAHRHSERRVLTVRAVQTPRPSRGGGAIFHDVNVNKSGTPDSIFHLARIITRLQHHTLEERTYPVILCCLYFEEFFSSLAMSDSFFKSNIGLLC